MVVDPDKPFNREEMYLAKAAGEGTTVPDEPWSRKEAYLDKISGRMDGMEEQIAALATDISLKGSVASQADLPETAAVGDAYITEDTGVMYVYVGESGAEPWVALGGSGGGDGIVELTTSDYDWPVSTPDGIALWKLDTGIYKANAGTKLYANSNDKFTLGEGVSALYDVSIINDTARVFSTYLGRSGTSTVNRPAVAYTKISDGSRAQIADIPFLYSRSNELLMARDIYDALTQSNPQSVYALSAYQGYLLDQKIQAIDGIKTLTEADYNYPADNPTSVVLSMLTTGVYKVKYTDGVQPTIKYFVGGGNQTFKDNEPIWLTPTVGANTVSIFRIGQGPYFNVIEITGSSAKSRFSLFDTDIAQETGTSQGKVMSQNATTSMVFADPSTKDKVQIGNSASVAASDNGVAIGKNAQVTNTGSNSIVIGRNTNASGQYSVAIATNAVVAGLRSVAIGNNSSDGGYNGSVGLGAYSSPKAVGEVNIGSTNTTFGYNSSNYRMISGVYDGQGLHDAATVAQGNTLATSAPTTSTLGVLGQLYTDTTAMHTYQCTAIDTTDPDNPVYTWTQRW